MVHPLTDIDRVYGLSDDAVQCGCVVEVPMPRNTTAAALPRYGNDRGDVAGDITPIMTKFGLLRHARTNYRPTSDFLN